MNRKVVWNACYGGFGLSPLAEKMLYETKHPGETVYTYKMDWETNLYLKVDPQNLPSGSGFFVSLTYDFGDSFCLSEEDRDSKINRLFESHFIQYEDIERHDPDLVRIVEELGSDKASGQNANLKIMDIGIQKYHIDEYDGFETVVTNLKDDYWV